MKSKFYHSLYCIECESICIANDSKCSKCESDKHLIDCKITISFPLHPETYWEVYNLPEILRVPNTFISNK